MTKASEVRSILRRRVLEKVAATAGNELSGIYGRIAAHQRPGIEQRGYRIGEAALKTPVSERRSVRQAPRPAPKPVTPPARVPQYYAPRVQAPKDYPGARAIDAADVIVSGAEKIRNGITGAIKPMLTGIGVGFNR